MQILYLFEKIKNPICDFLFSAITLFGDEILLMVIAILLFWCTNKRSGYYMLVSGFFGILVNQTLKLACKIRRPWIKEPRFYDKITDSVREAASGYSFPSGHSQNAVTVFGSIYLTSKKKWLKILCIIGAVLVPVSRMYLLVHTFWDVLAGSACAILILLLLENLFKDDKTFHKAMPYMIAALTVCTAAFFVYTTFIPHKILTVDDKINLESAMKNARTLLGCSLGLILVYPLDRFVIKFDTKASWYAQVLKVVIGFAVVLCIKEFTKTPLTYIIGEEYERVVRYFLIIAFGGALWPMTFKYFAKMKIPALDCFGEKVSSFFAKKELAPVEDIPKTKKVNAGVKNQNTSKKKR